MSELSQTNAWAGNFRLVTELNTRNPEVPQFEEVWIVGHHFKYPGGRDPEARLVELRLQFGEATSA